MICCWWCCHDIKERDIPMPYKYDDMRKKFHTTGHFCSWSCVKAYILDKNICTAKSSEMCQVLTLFRKNTEGKITRTMPAPSRFLLKMFGGPLSIEEFRKECSKPTMEMQFPEQHYMIPYVSKREHQSVTEYKPQELEHKMSTIRNATKKNDTLKLKRTKPLKRNTQKNTLESTLGIIIS